MNPPDARPNRALDLSTLAGPSWAGFFIIDGLFHHPYWKRPFSAADLLAQFYALQKLAHLEHENRQLRTELERTETALGAAQDRATYYRGQLTLESRAGLMLAALMT